MEYLGFTVHDLDPLLDWRRPRHASDETISDPRLCDHAKEAKIHFQMHARRKINNPSAVEVAPIQDLDDVQRPEWPCG